MDIRIQNGLFGDARSYKDGMVTVVNGLLNKRSETYPMIGINNFLNRDDFKFSQDLKKIIAYYKKEEPDRLEQKNFYLVFQEVTFHFPNYDDGGQQEGILVRQENQTKYELNNFKDGPFAWADRFTNYVFEAAHCVPKINFSFWKPHFGTGFQNEPFRVLGTAIGRQGDLSLAAEDDNSENRQIVKYFLSQFAAQADDFNQRWGAHAKEQPKDKPWYSGLFKS